MFASPIPTLLASCFLLSAPLNAQSLQFQVDMTQSLSSVDNSFTIQLPSTVIGNQDSITNPGGTRTVPGIFGGSGNNLIPMDLALGVDTILSSPASGNFQMDVDLQALTCALDNLNLDLLGGTTANTSLSVSMLFSTFRTFAPDSIYFGGIPIDLPLGSVSISQFTLVQNSPMAQGILVPRSQTGEFTFAINLQAELSFLMDFQGQQTPVGPVPIVIPFVGSLDMSSGQPTATITLDLIDQQQLLDPVPGFALTNVDLPLPTILPPGNTANLLLTSVISQLDTDVLLDIDLVAQAAPLCAIETFCSSAVNSTGQSAALQITGSLDVNAGQLAFDVSDLPINRPGIFFMSNAITNLPGFGGSQGTLCVGAPQLRFPQVQFSNAAGLVSFSPDFANLPGAVSFQADSTWHFQYWYRDSNPQATSNTSNGVRVRFCP
jgi:hypothetical protein